jgi:hypothetical protein
MSAATEPRPAPKLKVGDTFMRWSQGIRSYETWEVIDEPFWEMSVKGEQWWYPSRLTFTLNHPESEIETLD